MVAQSMETVLGKLKTLVEAISTSPNVSLSPRGSNQITAYPAADIVAGGSQVTYEVTGEYRHFGEIIIRLYSKSGRAEITTMSNEIGDDLANDHTLTDTCLECVLISTDPPMLFGAQAGICIADLILRVRLRRSYAP